MAGGVHGRGTCMAGRGAAQQGDMCGGGHAWQGEVCMAGEHAWQGNMHGTGACVAYSQ